MMNVWEVVEERTTRTWYRVEADSEDDALERYGRDGKWTDDDIIQTFTRAERVEP